MKKPDGLLLYLGLLSVSGGIGVLVNAGVGWIVAGLSTIVVAFVYGNHR